MPATGYRFYNLGDVSCSEIARSHPGLMLGRIAVNTSWDSGLLSRDDWPSMNGYAVSPPVTTEMLNEWPVSHDDYCDEWWIFKSAVPHDFRVVAFCNYNMTIDRYDELDFDGGCRLDAYLARFKPVALFGSNEFGYLVQRS